TGGAPKYPRASEAGTRANAATWTGFTTALQRRAESGAGDPTHDGPAAALYSQPWSRQSHCDGHQLSRYRGNITPPADFDQWATRIRKLVGHWVERYEVEEIYGAEVIKERTVHSGSAGRVRSPSRLCHALLVDRCFRPDRPLEGPCLH